jgi:hypothetical protein
MILAVTVTIFVSHTQTQVNRCKRIALNDEYSLIPDPSLFRSAGCIASPARRGKVMQKKGWVLLKCID